jgi:type I restriction enzyme M protein
MLSQETKKHIDNARQILVGVVPNPSSQIDQITNALIYKFMDDMDQASIKIGGNPSFFVNDLEKYSWTKLMDQKIGNQEKMNLYSEALQKFSLSPQLPELFRTIFKSAFLPYRSPETLGLFLTEIDYFDYSHSEELGNAYEYLLSIMSSQGDAGQFRTPRHIIEFIVDVLNPSKDDKILDPACGTGGFLVSAYKNILKQHDGKDDPEGKEKPLTPDQKRKMMQNFEGYDIDPTMARIAQVNMYLHQFKNPKIIQYDSLSQDEFWHDKFDVILANPPFMSPKGGIKPHSKFSIPSNRSEVLFVDYIINHLKPNGRSGIIVPEGIIFQSGIAYKNLRKNLIADGLYAVISLPSGVFQPYSGVKTSILLIDKEFAKKSNEILFIKIENDGFDLGAQRRVNVKNDLPQALQILQKFKNHFLLESPLALTATDLNNSPLESPSSFSATDLKNSSPESVSNVQCNHPPIESVTNVQCNHPPLEGGSKLQSNFGEGSKNFLLVPKSKIAENGDYNLSGDRYRVATDYSKAKWEMVELGEVCEVKKGSAITKKDSIEGFVPVIAGGQSPAYYHNQSNRFGKTITVSASGAYAGFINYFKIPIFASDCSTIQSKNETTIKTEFVFNILKGIQEKIYKLQTGGGQPHVYSKDLIKLKIPLPPLEIQEQIVSELDGYSSIIAGAKQIVANWKPKIDTDPSWEMVKLGEVCDVFGGGTPSRAVDEYWGGDIPWLSARYFSDEHKIKGSEMITKEGLRNSSSKIAPKGSTILITRVSVGKFAIADQDYAINQDLTALVSKSKNLDNKYLWIISELVAERIKNNAVGIGVTGVTRDFVINEEIPLPPLETQQQIVSQIEAERTLVESAKKLIEIYEQKTKAVIKKLWED